MERESIEPLCRFGNRIERLGPSEPAQTTSLVFFAEAEAQRSALDEHFSLFAGEDFEVLSVVTILKCFGAVVANDDALLLSHGSAPREVKVR